MSTPPTGQRRDSEDSDSGSGVWGALTYMAIGGGGSGRRELDQGGRPQPPGAPSPRPLPPGALALGLPALGFTGAGIAAGSVAAKLMSWSAIAHGGGVPAGGLVATMQSLGESGARPGSRHRGHGLSLYLLF